MEQIGDEKEIERKMKIIPENLRVRAEQLVASGRKLRALGFWSGKNASLDLPHPGIFQDVSWNAEEREMIITYLKQAPMVVPYLGVSYCRFECGETNMGSYDMSDGVYFWPEGLAHYLEKHNVRLPGEFIEHACKNIDLKNEEEDTQILWLLASDYSWWKSQGGWK
jgi:hypothetical protein